MLDARSFGVYDARVTNPQPDVVLISTSISMPSSNPFPPGTESHSVPRFPESTERRGPSRSFESR